MSTVLVVEDDTVSRRMAINMIEQMGHIVIASPNGKHAYETLKTNEGVDLVLTDIVMPEMDGGQLIEAIRKDADLAHLPIIAMSSVTGPEETPGIIRLGATFFIDKPFKLTDLQELIRRCLEDRQRL